MSPDKDQDQKPWNQPQWIERTLWMLDSYQRLLGHDLIDRSGSPGQQSENLFNADRVVVAHDRQTDPILNYANQRALELWETNLDTLLQMPSRLTAEPMHRDERAELLQRTSRDGYVDDYRGIRISAKGRRFMIEQAVVWNVYDDAGQWVGQAATFTQVTELS